jgi:hypothetical protein
MGIFFEQKPSTDFVNLVETAINTPPPPVADLGAEAVALAGRIKPLVNCFATALSTAPPTGPNANAAAHTAATTATQTVVNQLLGGKSFNTGRFLIALFIFGALLAVGVWTEDIHLTTASGFLFGFAGAIFGVVTAYLGSEKSST